MRLAIINRFSKSFINYEKIINEDDEIVMFNFHKEMELENNSHNKIYNYQGFDKSFYLDVIKEHKVKPFDKIIATSEFDIERVAELRDYLQIPGISYNEAIIFRDKFVMKQKLSKIINTPEFSEIKKWTDIITFIDTYGYPVIIKPRLEAGSEGISFIKNELDLKTFFVKNPNIFNMIIEKYLPHDMYHIDGFWDESKMHSFLVFKYINNGLSFMENDFIGSILIEDLEMRNLFKKKIEKIFSVLKHPQKLPFHAEFFKDKNNKIYLCEIAIRMGGGAIRNVYKFKTQNDFLELDIYNQAYNVLKPIILNKEHYGFFLIVNEEGILKSVPISENEKIIDYIFKKELINEKFLKPESWADSYITYILRGKSFLEILNNMKEINQWQIKNTIWKIEKNKD